LNTPIQSEAGSLLAIAHNLELLLSELDSVGAHLAAAHVDAAINQLRLDRAKSERKLALRRLPSLIGCCSFKALPCPFL